MLLKSGLAGRHLIRQCRQPIFAQELAEPLPLLAGEGVRDANVAEESSLHVRQLRTIVQKGERGCSMMCKGLVNHSASTSDWGTNGDDDEDYR